MLNKDIIGFLFRLLNAQNAPAILLSAIRINNPIVIYWNIQRMHKKSEHKPAFRLIRKMNKL